MADLPVTLPLQPHTDRPKNPCNLQGDSEPEGEEILDAMLGATAALGFLELVGVLLWFGVLSGFGVEVRHADPRFRGRTHLDRRRM